MKKLLTLAALAILAACNSNSPAPTADTTTTKLDSGSMTKSIQSPYEIAYSSKFVIDDPKNAESLLAIWKSFDNGDLSVAKDLFADTVVAYWGDGSMMRASRDSTLASAQAYRNSFKAVVSQVSAIMAVKSTDKNEHWVTIWGTETDTHKNGKVDSTHLQETWKFNQDGKAELMYQYKRPAAPPKK